MWILGLKGLIPTSKHNLGKFTYPGPELFPVRSLNNKENDLVLEYHFLVPLLCFLFGLFSFQSQ